jgi:hypothetical protein
MIENSAPRKPASNRNHTNAGKMNTKTDDYATTVLTINRNDNSSNRGSLNKNPNVAHQQQKSNKLFFNSTQQPASVLIHPPGSGQTISTPFSAAVQHKNPAPTSSSPSQLSYYQQQLRQKANLSNEYAPIKALKPNTRHQETPTSTNPVTAKLLNAVNNSLSNTSPSISVSSESFSSNSSSSAVSGLIRQQHQPQHVTAIKHDLNSEFRSEFQNYNLAKLASGNNPNQLESNLLDNDDYYKYRRIFNNNCANQEDHEFEFKEININTRKNDKPKNSNSNLMTQIGSGKQTSNESNSSSSSSTNSSNPNNSTGLKYYSIPIIKQDKPNLVVEININNSVSKSNGNKLIRARREKQQKTDVNEFINSEKRIPIAPEKENSNNIFDSITTVALNRKTTDPTPPKPTNKASPMDNSESREESGTSLAVSGGPNMAGTNSMVILNGGQHENDQMVHKRSASTSSAKFVIPKIVVEKPPIANSSQLPPTTPAVSVKSNTQSKHFGASKSSASKIQAFYSFYN